jgi:ABC-type multidrug transport system ATPase subunit
MNNTQSRLVTEELKKYYRAIAALKREDLDISASGVFAISGQSGAGKTSLIKCAIGID